MLKRKVSAYFTNRKYAFLIVFTALCAGMVTGAFGVLNSQGTPIGEINQITGKDIIISSFSENMKFLGWLVLWGVNLFGTPIVIYLLYVKGGTISAALCSLCASGGASGIMFVLSAVPYIACTMASIMILSQGSISCSFCLFRNIWGKRKGRALSEEILIMICEFIPAMLLALLGGVCETIFKVNIA